MSRRLAICCVLLSLASFRCSPKLSEGDVFMMRLEFPGKKRRPVKIVRLDGNGCYLVFRDMPGLRSQDSPANRVVSTGTVAQLRENWWRGRPVLLANEPVTAEQDAECEIFMAFMSPRPPTRGCETPVAIGGHAVSRGTVSSAAHAAALRSG